MTTPVRLSPVQHLLTEPGAAECGSRLVDESGNGKLLVEGVDAEKLVAGLQAYRLRPGFYFVGTPPLEEAAVAEKLRAQRGAAFATITDVTQGLSEFRLIGPTAPVVLSTVSGLDFSKFANGTAQQSSVAKTVQLIIRRDVGGVPAFSIIGARSLGAYLWDILQRSGAEQ